MHRLAGMLLLLCAAAPAGAQVLFDGELATRPDQQGWRYLSEPVFTASAVRTVLDGATGLDTTPDEDDHAGWFANVPPLPAHPLLPELDRSAGYVVRFRARLAEESHSSPNRAGLSVIVLSSDLMGVEIAFWPDEVWVQTDDPPFVHGEGAAFDTTASRSEYELCVLGDGYRLSADGSPLLEGALRDHSAFGPPYDIPDFLFVGDDTTSAQARFELARFEVELEPCGCRPAEPDADADGAPDCADGCPEDPAKIAPGACGCGFVDRDPDGDAVPDCDARPGDLYPEGVGDDFLDLRDFVVARRKTVLGSSPVGAWDLLASDLGPVTPACETAAGRLRGCPQPDGALDLEDAIAIRRLVAGRLEPSCEPCEDPPPPAPAALRLAGDLAPRASGGDGLVEVGDVLLALRWSVGLDAPPSAEELLRADVAPRVEQDGELVIRGDGGLGLEDVVAILRAAVGLDPLRWPVHRLHVDELGEAEIAAFSVTTSGWPPWARPAGFEAASCGVDEAGGLDVVAGSWSLTCADDPRALSAPVRLGSLRYRAPEAVDPASLDAAGQLVDGSESLIVAHLGLQGGD